MQNAIEERLTYIINLQNFIRETLYGETRAMEFRNGSDIRRTLNRTVRWLDELSTELAGMSPARTGFYERMEEIDQELATMAKASIDHTFPDKIGCPDCLMDDYHEQGLPKLPKPLVRPSKSERGRGIFRRWFGL